MTNRGWQYSMRPIDGADILIGMARCGYGGCQRISGLEIAKAQLALALAAGEVDHRVE